MLSFDEQARASRFRFQKDRDLFVMSHVALRILLGRATNATPHDLAFLTSPSGKPSLNGSSLHFNLSHSGDCAVIGICRSCEIGVDVEHVSAERGLKDLVESHFAHEERLTLEQFEGEAWVRKFYRVWTLKEAYLKAEGVGLIDALYEIEFDLSAGTETAIVNSPIEGFRSSDWSVFTPDVADDYACSVVLKGVKTKLDVQRLVPPQADFS